MKIWIVTGESESGDKYGPDVYDHQPTDLELESWCHMNDGSPEREGPGSYGSYVYVKVDERDTDTK